jgi:hypothetical protein
LHLEHESTRVNMDLEIRRTTLYTHLAKVDVASSSLVTRSPLRISDLGEIGPQLVKELLKTKVEFDRV